MVYSKPFFYYDSVFYSKILCLLGKIVPHMTWNNSKDIFKYVNYIRNNSEFNHRYYSQTDNCSIYREHTWLDMKLEFQLKTPFNISKTVLNNTLSQSLSASLLKKIKHVCNVMLKFLWWMLIVNEKYYYGAWILL